MAERLNVMRWLTRSGETDVALGEAREIVEAVGDSDLRRTIEAGFNGNFREIIEVDEQRRAVTLQHVSVDGDGETCVWQQVVEMSQIMRIPFMMRPRVMTTLDAGVWGDICVLDQDLSRMRLKLQVAETGDGGEVKFSTYAFVRSSFEA
jgi:hypothetical protein